ncbi:MAG: bifunctional hydroxymethylpyrimidine kinase/phosphomethylpyrimidine kinase [Methanomicrobiales archaeon]
MKRFMLHALSTLAMEIPQVPCACTIAGSDPSGGAGIQSDIKTFSALGVWGLSVITALTSQNANNVRGIWNVPEDVIRLQLVTLLEDFDIRAFKTGMLYDLGAVAAAVWCIPKRIPLVVDPVMVSSSGRPLMDPEALNELVEELLPRATIVTPNLPEAEVLSGNGTIRSLDDMRAAGRSIMKVGPEYVLVKGGHLPDSNGEVTDLLIGHEQEWIFSGERLPFGAHGTGCCLSAAITGYLALGNDVPAACAAAKEFVGHAIGSSITTKSGCHVVNPGFGGM